MVVLSSSSAMVVSINIQPCRKALSTSTKYEGRSCTIRKMGLRGEFGSHCFRMVSARKTKGNFGRGLFR